MEETIRRLSQELGLPQDVIKKSYKAYWMFIKQSIEKLPLRNNIDEVTFGELRQNFNIPNLGKLACTYNRYIGLRKRNQLIKKKDA